MSSTQQLPNNNSLAFVAGDDFSFSVDIDRDLTGYTISAYLVTDPVVNFALEWVDQTLGQFILSLTDTQTATLTGPCQWVLEWVDDGGDKRTLIQGKVTVYPNV